MMGLIMLLIGVLIVPNLVTPPLYIDGSCDDGVDHAADRCPHCSQSRDTAPLYRR